MQGLPRKAAKEQEGDARTKHEMRKIWNELDERTATRRKEEARTFLSSAAGRPPSTMWNTPLVVRLSDLGLCTTPCETNQKAQVQFEDHQCGSRIIKAIESVGSGERGGQRLKRCMSAEKDAVINGTILRNVQPQHRHSTRSPFQNTHQTDMDADLGDAVGGDVVVDVLVLALGEREHLGQAVAIHLKLAHGQLGRRHVRVRVLEVRVQEVLDALVSLETRNA
eukprot:2040256-Rhodomonas_salina.4